MKDYDIINGTDASFGQSRATLGDWLLGILAVTGIALLFYVFCRAFVG